MSIYVIFSADGGATWSAPVAVNGSHAEWGPVLTTDLACRLLYVFCAESGDELVRRFSCIRSLGVGR